MQFRIALSLVVATFLASCNSFTNADLAAAKGPTVGSPETRRLREDGAIQDEEKPLSLNVVGTKSQLKKQPPVVGTLATDDSDQVAPTSALKERLEKKPLALSKNHDERGYWKGAGIGITAAVIAAIGTGLWLTYGHTKHMPQSSGTAMTGSSSGPVPI
uniref:RxLR effector candidate protein n=2 Tax=Hyaloperonospora arabidopsidis (strain Emoy2) TaxID=559515 RepID=M4C6S4_HYAAE|nr:RxLR effector candidate protein [Hyaloperonospora arabidopsidis Emoy2]